MKFSRFIVQILILSQFIFSQQQPESNIILAEDIHNTTENCLQCHLKEYFDTNAPNHLSYQYQPEDCQNCHGTVQWLPNIFIHKNISEERNCISCHSQQLIISNEIVSGHDHLANDCTTCHQTDRWDRIVFNHSSTRYILKSNESNQDCLTCHFNGFVPDVIICPECEPVLKDNK